MNIHDTVILLLSYKNNLENQLKHGYFERWNKDNLYQRTSFSKTHTGFIPNWAEPQQTPICIVKEDKIKAEISRLSNVISVLSKIDKKEG